MTADSDRTSGATLLCITSMPAYQHKSLEELRYEDYLKKSDPAAAQALAAQSKTSAAAPTSAGNAFGGGAFGSAAASPFGAPAANTQSAFGTANTQNAFGAPKPAAFGTPAPAFTGAFGAAAPAQSAFGAPAQPAFGAPTTPAANAGGFSFGVAATSANKPGTFGAPAANAFGAPAANAFGAPAANSFGAPAANTFGAPATSSFGTNNAFGTSTTPVASGFGGNAFGTATTTPAAANSGFSFGAKPATPAASGFGGFGGGGSFGATASTTPNAFGAASTTPNAFGGAATATTPAAGGFSFAQAKPAAGTSLFSTTTPSAFGAPAAVPSSFGATNAFAPAGGNSLFSSAQKPSMFGGAATGLGAQQPSAFGGLQQFGSMMNPNQQQQPLVAAPNTNPYGIGAVGAGLVQQQVQAALALPISKNASDNSVGVGVPRGVDKPATGYSSSYRTSSYRYTPKTQPTVGARTPSKASTNLLSSQRSVFDAGMDAQLLSPEVFKSNRTKHLVIAPEKKTTTLAITNGTPGSSRGTGSAIAHNTSSGTFELKCRFKALDDIYTYRSGGSTSIRKLKEELAGFYNQSPASSGDSIQAHQVLVILDGKALSDDTQVRDVPVTPDSELDVVVNVASSAASPPPAASPKSSTITSSVGSPFLHHPQAKHPTPAASKPGIQPDGRILTYEEFYNSNVNGNHDSSTSSTTNGNSVRIPRLTKHGYYTIPDLATLSVMTDAELANVEDFTVGCKEFGSIQWIGFTDVRDVDLDNIIEFLPKQVDVYPDEENKPAVGQSLNKPALISLFGVFPPKSSKKSYVDRIKKKTVDIGATFIDYDESTGVWTFRTEHFSRYGLDDDEEESEDVEEEQKDNEESEPMSNLTAKLPYQLQLDPKRMHLLRASLFAPAISPTAEPENENVLALSMQPHAPQIVSSELALLPPPPATFQVKTNIKFQPLYTEPKSKSLTYEMYRRLGCKDSIDMGMFMGRSFRTSFGPSGQLVVISATNRSTHQVDLYTPFCADEQTKTQVEKNFQVHLKHALPIPTASPATLLPYYQLPSDAAMVQCLHEYIQAAVGTEVDSRVWTLMNALFGQECVGEDALLAPVKDDERLADTRCTIDGLDRRREGISRWLEDTIGIETEGDVIPDNTYDRILYHLSRHELEAACDVAVDSKHLRLATLLAQADVYHAEPFRQLLAEQLRQWSHSGAQALIDDKLWLLYQLLSGEIVFLEQLSWKQNMAMILWYHQGPGQRITTALDQLTHELSRDGDNALLSYPDPDGLYQLLQLYTERQPSVRLAIAPSGFTTNVMDMQTSWHLYAVLHQYNHILPPVYASGLTHAFVFQLECLGLWHWAVYVALGLEEAVERQATVKQLLSRHVQQEETTGFAFCQNVLSLPDPWLYEALAVRASIQHEVKYEIVCWTKAGKWTLAHDSIIEKLAPKCLFDLDLDTIEKCLEPLEGHMHDIAKWHEQGGGHMYLEYCRVQRLTFDESWELAQLQQVQERIVTLCDVLTEWNPTDTLKRICVSSMLSTMTHKAMTLNTLLQMPVTSSDGFKYRADYFGEKTREDVLSNLCTAFIAAR